MVERRRGPVEIASALASVLGMFFATGAAWAQSAAESTPADGTAPSALVETPVEAPPPPAAPEGAAPAPAETKNGEQMTPPAPPAPIEGSELEFFSLEADLVKVVSASHQEEPSNETPVPVTVITSEMIKAIGAKNLQEVLVAYVPGMTFAMDHNELIVAMRGVYASSQQKILVMLDGHRLNSRAYSMANPDASISLDKVKQIEVLRGPGSSLYGNVALAGVINLVTKSGRDVDGADLRAGIGDYGLKVTSFLYGKEIGRSELLLWGATYYADGQRIPIDPSRDFALQPRGGYAIVGGVKDPLNYDLGLKVRVGDFSLLASRRLGKIVEPFTSAGTTGEVYDYASFRPMRTVGPGLASRSNHLEVKFARGLSDHFHLEARAYYDTNELLSVLTQDPVARTATYLDWDEDAMGLVAMGRYEYEAGPAGTGNLTVGTQLEGTRLLDSNGPRAVDGVWANFGKDPTVYLLEPGNEGITSGFAQLKHRLSDFIFNFGARFDEKTRHRSPNKDISDLSPRLAVVYSPARAFDVKLSYAQSFVDAPYWYRYNSLPSYRGADTLLPEHLRSVQLTPTVTLFGGKLSNRLNVYYNHLFDFVFRDNSAPANQPLYRNAGTLRSTGVEDEVAWLQDRWRLRANVSWQRMLEAKDFGGRDGRVYNVPSFVGNLIADVDAVETTWGKVKVNGLLRYTSSRLSPITSKWVGATGNVLVDYSDPNHTEPGYWLVNLGARVIDLVTPGVTLDATIYNLFNERAYEGGSVSHPYPTTGRWLLVNLTYHASL